MANTVVFHIPNDPEWLQAYGRVSIVHAHLDHILKMLIKTLAEVSVDVALDATVRTGSAELRDRVKKLAKARLGEGQDLIRVQALVERCRRATEQRNAWIHSQIVSEWDHETGKLQSEGGQLGPLPTAQEMNALTQQISSLVGEINEARLYSWLKDALEKRPNPKRSHSAH